MQQILFSPNVVRGVEPAGRQMRIAVVTESYPPEVNGVANSVARVVEGLRARNHTVQLVRPRQAGERRPQPSDRRQEVLTAGMAIPLYSHLRMGLPCRRWLLRLWTLRRPDVVHIATEGPLGWSALRAAMSLKLPVVSDFRTNFQAYCHFYGIGWLHQPVMAYLRWFHNRCHGTMVPTDALREQLDAAGFGPLSVVARGVDTSLFSPAKRSIALRREWGVGDDDVVVLHVGRLAAEKNLPVLLAAFASLRSVQPRARLVVVGDGPARMDMQMRCPQAIYAGFRTGEDLAAHYASSDLFLFPSLTETYGNVTAEAMASGLAVLAFDDAAAGQLIRHRSSGVLASKSDVPAFSRLACLVAGDAAMRRQLGENARMSALALGWDSVVRQIEDVYSAAAARASAPVPTLVWARPA